MTSMPHRAEAEQAGRYVDKADARPLVPAAVTVCRHLSKIFVTVGRFGLVSRPPSHPTSSRS